MGIRFYYAPDTGADGAAAPAAEPAAAPAAAEPAAGPVDVAAASIAGDTPAEPAEPPKPAAPPKWSSQLSPEAREKHKDILEAMGEGTSLTDAFSELVETKGKLSRSILLPEKDNPEDVKRFMQEMGIPETLEGYEIDEKVLGKEVTAIITQQAMKSGMTKRQAQAMHGFIASLMKQGQAGVAEATKQRAESFDKRMAEAAGSPEAGEAAKKYATKFLIRFGDKDTITSLEKTGMIYNTKFMSKLAEFEKALGDTKFVSGDSPSAVTTKGGEKKGAFGTYNKDFTDRYGVAK